MQIYSGIAFNISTRQARSVKTLKSEMISTYIATCLYTCKRPAHLPSIVEHGGGIHNEDFCHPLWIMISNNP
jgi:hypothetical protein